MGAVMSLNRLFSKYLEKQSRYPAQSKPFRRLCWFSCACSAGIFGAVYLLPDYLHFSVGFLCVVTGAVFLMIPQKLRPTLVAFGLAGGILWTGIYSMIFRVPAHNFACEDRLPYTMLVVDFPRETSYGGALTVRLQTGGISEPLVSLYAGEDALELRPGDLISARVRLSRSDLRHGETYDYDQSRGIYLSGSVTEKVSLLQRPQSISIRFLPQYASNHIKNIIFALVPSDVSGFLVSLLTGDKSTLPDGLYAAFRRSGIAHVVAVSGLHLSFLSGLVFTLLGKRGKISAIVMIPLLFFFAAATGNSPSALRAAIMSSVLLAASLLRRENDKPTSLAFVLMLLLLFCPFSASSVSLQLSFGSVAGIYLVSGPLHTKWMKNLPRWKGFPETLLYRLCYFLFGTLATTLGALLFSTPLSAIYFHSVSLAGPLTNLLTLWAVSATFFVGLIAATIGMVFPPLGSFLGWLAAWPARWVIFIAQSISHWPFATLSLFSGYALVCFLTAYGVLLLWLFSRGKVRPLIPLGVLSVSLLAAQLLPSYQATQASLSATILDVGQGSSTLLLSEGKAILVDCGGNEGNAGDIAADHIQSYGISELDALVLTHYDSDHTNGVPELLARLPVSRLILSEEDPDKELRDRLLSLAHQYNCEVEFLYRDDMVVSFGAAEAKVIIPMGAGSSNESGLSVLCSSEGFDVLITGDMSTNMEKRLLKYRQLPEVELLVVGHHGSASSTSSELLQAIMPKVAVISVGYNSYGHPEDETLARLKAAGCAIYRTDWMGDVTVSMTRGVP